MTMPNLQFPTINPGGVIQQPGIGQSIADGLAGVLAAQQQQKENEYKLQQLQQQQAQQQALADYYQGTLAVQNREQDRLGLEQQQKIAGQRQVGLAQQQALGVGQQPQQPQQPQPGNTTQGQDTTGLFKQVLSGGAQALAPAQGNPDVLGTPAGMSQTFQGVDAENMPAAVAGVQEAQKLQPQAPELPASGKEFEFVRHLMQVDPSGESANFFMKNWVSKGPQTVINNIPQQGATEFQKQDAENQANVIKESEDQSRQAFASLPALSEAYKMVERGDAFTGMGAKVKLKLARVGALFGIPEAQMKVANTQALLKLTGDQVLSYLRTRVLGSNNAVSDGDRIFMEGQAGRDITQDRFALQKIMRINYGSALLRQSEAISDLRTQAQNYPDAASNLMRRSVTLQKQYEVSWKNYAEMLAKEGVAEAEIKSRMVGAGVQDPDAILRGVSLKPKGAVDLGNQLFPVR